MIPFCVFRRAAFGALFALAISIPIAARADPAAQPSAVPVPEIGRVSTSDRHDEPISRTTRTTFVVDRTRIEARGDRTIADALADVPGVELYRYGAFGAQAIVSVRGASSANVLILLDGVPLTPGSNEQIDVGSLSTAGVGRIEVLEGCAATLYGSNAVGGVINIITAAPRGTYLEASAGTLQDRDLRVGVGNGRLGVSFERHIARNNYAYPAQAPAGATPIPAGARDNADAEQTAARIAYDTDLGPHLTARVRVGSDVLHLGVPGSLVYGVSPFARENVSRADAHLDITHTGANSATTLTLFGLHQNLDYVDPSQAIENPTIDGRTQLSLQNVTQAGPSSLTVGIDVARETALLGNIAQYDNTGNISGYATIGETQPKTALYAQEQYRFHDAVQINAGLRAESDGPQGSGLTPSLGIGIPLRSGLRLLINGGTAFRVPTIIDRYYPGYSNPTLRPERSKDADVTLHSDALLGGASVGFFLRDAANLIVVNAQSIPENVARASLRGFIGTLQTRPFHGFVSTLSVTDTYTAQNVSPGAAATRLFFTPVFVSKLGLEHGFGNGGYAFGANATILGPHTESVGYNSAGQTTVDVYVRARPTPGSILAVRVKNVGNERYAPLLGYPAPGRTVEVELATR